MAKLITLETLSRNAVAFCIILWILVHTESSDATTSTRYRRSNGGDIDRRWLMEEHNDELMRKRIIRSPLDGDEETEKIRIKRQFPSIPKVASATPKAPTTGLDSGGLVPNLNPLDSVTNGQPPKDRDNPLQPKLPSVIPDSPNNPIQPKISSVIPDSLNNPLPLQPTVPSVSAIQDSVNKLQPQQIFNSVPNPLNNSLTQISNGLTNSVTNSLQSKFLNTLKDPLSNPFDPKNQGPSLFDISTSPELPPEQQKALDDIYDKQKGELYLPENYNNLVIPKLKSGNKTDSGMDEYMALRAGVFLNIKSVQDLDESEGTLTLDVNLVVKWVDGLIFDENKTKNAEKLQGDVTLNPIFLEKIWKPDIYLDEIVKTKQSSLMSMPISLKINPSTAFISYKSRLRGFLSCDMKFHYYPADTQECEFTFRSFSYLNKDMTLEWIQKGVYLQDPADPNFDIQVTNVEEVKLNQTFENLGTDDEYEFDGLKFTISARRKLSYHLVQTYLPSIFFIVITWLCFLVPARMVEARMGISMTTLLTLTAMFASVRDQTPVVSYVKAIDIWMVAVIFFVFVTLLQFSVYLWLKSRREDVEERKLEERKKLHEINGKNGNTEATFVRSASLESVQLRKIEQFMEFTDKFAFLIYAVVFSIFTTVYWAWLLGASKYFDWDVDSDLNNVED